MTRIRSMVHPAVPALAATTLLFAGATDALASHAAPARARAAAGHTVSISNFAYHPKTIVVSRGTTVRFVNQDKTNHTVTADHGAFNLGNFNLGQAHSFRFTRRGTYTYHCTYHPFMHGKVVVR